MTSKTDRLSEALDQLNTGLTPEPADEETADLLEVASLLRDSGLPVQPPEHLLTATVRQAAAGLASRKTSRRNSWLYSGVLSAAAALLLFVGIHGFPSVNEFSPAVSPALPSSSSAATASHDATLTAGKSVRQEESPVPSPTSVPAPGLTVKPDQPSPPPAAPSQPPQETALTKKTAPAPAPAARLAALPKTALILPGRTPDAISRDSASGIIRQIYDKGTPQELTITQRPPEQALTAEKSQNRGIAAREAFTAKTDDISDRNTIVVQINGQEVILESRLTKQELSAIAQQLRSVKPATVDK